MVVSPPPPPASFPWWLHDGFKCAPGCHRKINKKTKLHTQSTQKLLVQHCISPRCTMWKNNEGHCKYFSVFQERRSLGKVEKCGNCLMLMSFEDLEENMYSVFCWLNVLLSCVATLRGLRWGARFQLKTVVALETGHCSNSQLYRKPQQSEKMSIGLKTHLSKSLLFLKPQKVFTISGLYEAFSQKIVGWYVKYIKMRPPGLISARDSYGKLHGKTGHCSHSQTSTVHWMSKNVHWTWTESPFVQKPVISTNKSPLPKFFRKSKQIINQWTVSLFPNLFVLSCMCFLPCSLNSLVVTLCRLR